jgi:hypothetical protein
MRKKSIISVIVALLASKVFGIDADELLEIRAALTNRTPRENFYRLMDKHRDSIPYIMSQLNGIELLLTYGVDSVSVTPTSLTIKAGAHIAPWWGLEPYAELTLTLDKEIVFAENHASIVFSPVSLKNKQNGFRINSQFNARSFGGGLSINTAYIALSDTSIEIEEKDVEMIMEETKWVTAEAARKRLESRKLSPIAEILFQQADEIKRDPKLMAEVLANPWYADAWNTLLEKGYITANTVEKEGGTTSTSQEKRWFGKQDGVVPEEERATASPPSRLWLYVGISLCVLVPILYFLRRKFTNH